MGHRPLTLAADPLRVSNSCGNAPIDALCILDRHIGTPARRSNTPQELPGIRKLETADLARKGAEMTQPVALGLQVVDVSIVRSYVQWLQADDLQAGSAQRRCLVWIVGQQAYGVDAKRTQHGSSVIVLAVINGEAKMEIRVYGIGAGVLNDVGAKFVDKSHAAAFMSRHVDHDSSFSSCDCP